MTPDDPTDLAALQGLDRETELAALYEVARALLGAHRAPQVAARLVRAGMGALGARSGALFLAEGRGRLRLAHAAGLGSPPVRETLALDAEAIEWLAWSGPFPLAVSATARRLGPARDQLRDEFDAVWAVGLTGPQGLAGLVVFGPRRLDGGGDHERPVLLESLAMLGAQALEGVSAAGAGAARAAARPRKRAAARTLDALRREHPPLQGIVGESAALAEALQELVAAAGHRFPVLLTGESGVGKELAARAVHDLSDRAEAPFEVVDCGSLPAELIESELFGHVKGSFTGAHKDRRGAFEMAHRGTLFLDEIGEMPMALQTRLLRVIQESRFRRVGDERVIDADVRVIAATNRDLRTEVAARRFREDLYYRLNVFAVRLPALRERPSDLPVLVEHFLRRQGREMGVREWDVDPDAMGALAAHAWPGNIRELSNFCAGLAVRGRADGTIAMEDLDAVWRRQHGGDPAPWTAGAGARPSAEELGAWVLEQARAARFNLVDAARALARAKRSGRRVPISERSALSYYLTGEILRAFVAASGNPEAACRALALDDPPPQLVSRARRIVEALRESGGDPAKARRRFGKVPPEYDEALERAVELV